MTAGYRARKLSSLKAWNWFKTAAIVVIQDIIQCLKGFQANKVDKLVQQKSKMLQISFTLLDKLLYQTYIVPEYGQMQ